MSEDILYQHKLIGNVVTLYKNRIEFERGGMFGKKETILLKGVVDIGTGFGQNMVVLTTGGKKHVLPVSGKAADEMKAKILELL